MAKKRATKRKAVGSFAENDENRVENNNIENGLESGSKTAKKKKSVATPRSSTRNGTPSTTKPKPSKNKSESEEDEDQEYEVEKILDVKYKKNNKREFLIRWKNYSKDYDTWEAEDNLACDELIAKFIEEQEKNKKKSSKSESEDEDKDEEYEVEKILDIRQKKNKREFLIRWKNYSEEHDTWEAEENLACDELIAAFLKNHEQGKSKLSKSKSEDDEEKDYEVEKILDVNYKKNNKREFLIRWKNYSSKHDTWEPEENLDCDELIKKFLEVQEQRAKQPRKELREKPKAVSRYAPPGGNRKSRRTAGTRKSYVEEDDE